MSISKKDVSHVAGLARLKPSDEELDLYTGQLQRILAHVDKISELDTTGVEPTTSTTPVRGPMREDTVIKSLTQIDALLNSPESAKGCFKVPKIIE
ncbi:MAG: Asp-tRNA(Asn)/Glu-tRNA(Gln) amidotransferase subunit GatC [Proteobacteria bacterium]|nr:Asp-tRNA(Asn)/Glu-tRNA(Gln) amidotransferase subunit GatC [Pseudomonadota bacterium]